MIVQILPVKDQILSFKTYNYYQLYAKFFYTNIFVNLSLRDT